MIRSILLIVALAAISSLAGETEFAQKLAPFIQQHCIDCHGPDVQKAKLRLDTLKPAFGDKAVAETWIAALDKITSGQMPPAAQDRPKPDEVSAAAGWLRAQLHAASLHAQQTDGRVLLRRMNRTEYETTLRDLLGINFEVSDLLPDDNIAAGFDNVSTALDLSASHFVRFQDAAERALAKAVPVRPPKTYKDRKTGKEILDKNTGLQRYLGKWLRNDGDAMVLLSRAPHYSNFISYPYGIQPGKYRVTLSASAINNQGKSMPVVFARMRENVRDDGEPLGCFDIQDGKPTEISLVFELLPRERLQVNGWTLPSEQEFNNAHKDGVPKDFPGPGFAVHSLELEGPLDEFPGPGYRKLFGDLPLKARSVIKAEQEKKTPPKITDKRGDFEWGKDPLVPFSANPKADSEKLLRGFLPLAFRRPVDESIVQFYCKMVTERLEKGYAFDEAMLVAYKAALCSPEFLFLREPAGALDGPALAARLSYFIWRTAPDADLQKLAESGELLKSDVLHAQLERLLKDPRSKRFIDDFTGQWLDLKKINATAPDPQLYSEFDHYLQWSMPQETTRFFAEVLEKNLSVTQFVDSDWTFVNERLGQQYGFKDAPKGSALQRVAVPPGSHRGGVLTHASILKVTADGTRTSPILRGKWVLQKIVGKPPSPPPPDVPTVEPDIRGATTIRKQLEKHRSTAACNACHKFIDPPGFALETYDVIGGWRETYRAVRGYGKKTELANYPGKMVQMGLKVEKGDTTPDGRAFKDIDDYKKILLEDKDQLARNVIEKLMVFSTGADIQFADREVIEAILADARKSDFGLRTIIHGIVGSRVFLNK